jgi:hypothetical protein
VIVRTRTTKITLVAVAALLGTVGAMAQTAVAGPPPKALAAFHQYVAQAESQIRREESAPDSFLGLRAFPTNPNDLEARLRRGETVVTSGGITPVEVPGGLIHHWIGIVFIPQATISQVFAVLQNYDQMARYYSPDVAASRLIKRDGDDFRISLRLREHKIITVMLDGLYDVKYGRLDADHQFSVSRSMQMVEVADDAPADDAASAAGGPAPDDSDDPPPAAHDHGFLWRTNAYWRFEQADDGVFVEFESISLSRDVPTGWGWLVEPFIREIPRQSLLFTLRATRKAVLANDVASDSQPAPLVHRP